MAVKIKYPLLKRTLVKTDGYCLKSQNSASSDIGAGLRCQNLLLKDGLLDTKIGSSKLKTTYSLSLAPSEITSLGEPVPYLFLYKKYNSTLGVKDDCIIASTKSGKLKSYSLRSREWTLLSDSKLGEMSAINYNFNGNDVALINFGVSGSFILNGNTLTALENAPNITSLAVMNERIYATVSDNIHRIWFCDDFDPTNWNVTNGGGFIDLVDNLGGSLLVANIGERIIVVREYGLSVISGVDKDDLCALDVCALGTQIIPGSIAVGANKIAFATNNAFYTFDGYSLKRLKTTFDNNLKRIHTNYSVALINEDCYHLAFRLENTDMSEIDPYVDGFNDTLLELNLLDYTIQVISGIDVQSILLVYNEYFSKVTYSPRVIDAGQLYEIDESGSFDSSNCEKIFESGKIKLPICEGIIIEKICIYSECVATFELTIDNNTNAFSLNVGDNVILVGKRAFAFSYKITTTATSGYIYPPSLIVKYSTF